MSCRGGLMTIDSGKIKRNGLCDRRWFLRHGGVAVPLIFVALRAQGAERAGTVEDVKGEAFAEAAAVRRALDRAAPLFLGDTVGTGVESRLGMRLGRDTTIRLGEKARLKIDRFLVNAGGDVTVWAAAIRWAARQRSGSDADPQSLRPHRGARYAFFCRSKQRPLRGVRRARLGGGHRRRAAGHPSRWRGNRCCLTGG